MYIDETVGFAIGQDYAFYGVSPEPGCPAAIRHGYVAGRQQHAFQHKTDRYVLKWLQLRFNAFTRGKYFSANVTPEYLKRIDREVCPVTGVRLTRGMDADTDWSVDRVLNDGAYAVGNLAVMSRKANQAKGARSILGLIALASAGIGRDGLTAAQWRIMAQELVMFENLRPEVGRWFGPDLLQGQEALMDVPMTPLMALQWGLVLYLERLKGMEFFPGLMRHLSNSSRSRRNMHKFLNRMLKRRQQYADGRQYMQWGNSGTSCLFHHWCLSLGKSAAGELAGTMSDVYERSRPENFKIEELHLEPVFRHESGATF